MRFVDPQKPPEPPGEPRAPDLIERTGTLAMAFVFAALLIVGLDGSRRGGLEPGYELAWLAVAISSGLAFVALLVSLRSAAPLARLGLVSAPLRTTAWGCAGIVFLSHGLDSLLAWFSPGGSAGLEATRDAIANAPASALPFLLIAIAGLTPLGEELLFRGLIQRGLMRWGSPTLAVGVASSLFAAAHGDWLYGALTLALGVSLGLLVLRSDSLLPALAAHATNNLVAVLEANGRMALPTYLENPALGAPVGIGVGLAFLALALREPRQILSGDP